MGLVERLNALDAWAARHAPYQWVQRQPSDSRVARFDQWTRNLDTRVSGRPSRLPLGRKGRLAVGIVSTVGWAMIFQGTNLAVFFAVIGATALAAVAVVRWDRKRATARAVRTLSDDS